MPRYHALDTAIELCVWDRQTPGSKADGNDGHSTSTTTDFASMLKDHGLEHPKKKEAYGPAAGHFVDILKEEYFEDQEGVDFLGPAMPFYLVKAGKELFRSLEKDEDLSSSAAREENPTQISSTALANDTEDTRPSSQPSSADNTLSSIDTEFLSPKRESFSTPELGEPDKLPEITVGYAKPGLVGSSHGPQNAITSQKPIAIKVDLSTKSFMPSINTHQRQELCITIFYNGELTHSRILRANTLGSLQGPVGDEKYQYFSGRRIDSFIEVPWLLHPRPARDGAECLGFDERWNKVNESLLVEAEQWGHYGRFRSPMGEYLEELSKLPVPHLQENEQFGGARAGIIDVAITLGRSVDTARSGLREPRRKLHEDRCGKLRRVVFVPQELRPKKKAKIVAQFNLEASRNSIPQPLNMIQQTRIISGVVQTQSSNAAQRSMISPPTKSDKAAFEHSSIGKRPGYTVVQNPTVCNMPPTPSISHDQNKDGSSESFPALVNRHEYADFRSPNSQRPGLAVMSQQNQIRRASLPMASSPLSHQKMPKHVPQKRYKGTHYLDDPPPKRRKLENDLKALGCLPLDSEEPISSTRSTRAASSPAAPVPYPDTFPGRPFKGGQRLHASKIMKGSEQTSSNGNQGDNSQKTDHIAAEGTITSIGNGLQSERHSRPFSYDGTSDEPRRTARPRSSTGSAQSRRSLPKRKSESAAETPASSIGQFSQQVPNQPNASKDVIRIVFMTQDQEASSAFVDRKKFEGLHLEGSSTDDATQKIQAKPVTEHVVAEKTSSGSSVPKNKQKRRDSSTADMGSTGGKVFPTAQSEAANNSVHLVGKAVFTPQPDSMEDMRSMGGKTIFLPPAPPYKRQRKQSKPDEPSEKARNAKERPSHVETCTKTQPKPKTSSDYSAKQTNSTSEGPTKTKTPSKAQSKPRTGSVCSRKTGNTASVGSEKPETLPKSHLRGPRDSVSSRELKDLLTPHERSAAINTSFGSSFKDVLAEASKRARSSRNPKPAYVPPTTSEVGANSTEAGTSAPLSTVASGNGAVATNRKSSNCRKAPMLPNLTACSTDEAEVRADPAAKLLGEVIEDRSNLRTNSSQRKPQDQAIAIPAPKSQVCPVEKIKAKAGGTSPNYKESGDAKPSEDLTHEHSMTAKNARNLSSQVTTSGRPYRRYSVDSEGKKIPTPRAGSLANSTSSPSNQAKRSPHTPTNTAPRRKSPDGYSKKTLPTSSPAQQNGGIETIVTTTKVAATFARPKMSVSDTITCTTPSPLATAFASVKTPTSQSIVKTKRKADDISISTSDSGNNSVKSSRLWKPTSLCNGSVLTYARNEAFYDTAVDPASNHVYRTVKAEREGVFRASGVLMGVRFVVGF